MNVIKPKLLYISSDAEVSMEYTHKFISSLQVFFNVSVFNVREQNHINTLKLNVESFYPNVISTNVDRMFFEEKYNFSYDFACSPYSEIYKIPRFFAHRKLDQYLQYVEDNISLDDYDLILTGPGNEYHKMAVEVIANSINKEITYHGESLIDNEYTFIYKNYYNEIRELEGESILINGESNLKKSGTDDLIKYGVISSNEESVFEKVKKSNAMDLYRSFVYKARLAINSINTSLFSLICSDKTVLDNNNVILFPLHVIEDSQILFRNRFYKNQERVIREILHYLPRNYKLAVKAHPGNCGRYPLGLMKLIKNEKMIFLQRDIPATTLLDKVSGVITINSTVGIEAMKKNVPVGVIGRWGIAESGYFDCIDLNKPDTIYKFLKSLSNDRGTAAKEAIKKLMDSSYPGQLHGKVEELNYNVFAQSLHKRYCLFNELEGEV